jgi:hypothetical protein
LPCCSYKQVLDHIAQLDRAMDTARICVVCQKRTREPTYGFRSLLIRLGVALQNKDGSYNDKAHDSCIRKLQR